MENDLHERHKAVLILSQMVHATDWQKGKYDWTTMMIPVAYIKIEVNNSVRETIFRFTFLLCSYILK